MKHLKDFLPFYIGQDVYNGNEIGTLVGVRYDSVNQFSEAIVCYAPGKSVKRKTIRIINPADLRLILRPASSLTLDEMIECQESAGPEQLLVESNKSDIERFMVNIMYEAPYLLWLTKKGIDVFGLIPARLAFDKTISNSHLK